MPLLLSRNGQGWHIDNDSIVNYQRRRRDFVLRSIASAAAGIVVVPPLLDPAPVVADNSKATATASGVTIDPLAQLPRITHKAYLDIELGSEGGKKGRLVIDLFGEIMPRMVGNFLALCADRSGGNAGFLPALV
jgi:hypothetical protein